MDEVFVTVARFDWLTQAELAQCRLEACGIDAFLPDEFTASLCWHYGKVIGGIRLQVPPADAEDARVVLNDQPLPQSEPILTEHERTTERALQSAAFSIAWEPFSSLFSVAAFAGV